MTEERPVIVRIKPMNQHKLVIPTPLIPQPVEQSVSMFAFSRLPYPCEPSHAIIVINADIIKPVSTQIVFGIFTQSGFVRMIEEIVNTCDTCFQMQVFVRHVSSCHLHHQRMCFLHLAFRTVKPGLVNGSNLSILHNPVQIAVRIESGCPPRGIQSEGSPYSTKIIVLIGRTMLAETFRMIFGRGQ